MCSACCKRTIVRRELLELIALDDYGSAYDDFVIALNQLVF